MNIDDRMKAISTNFGYNLTRLDNNLWFDYQKGDELDKSLSKYGIDQNKKNDFEVVSKWLKESAPDYALQMTVDISNPYFSKCVEDDAAYGSLFVPFDDDVSYYSPLLQVQAWRRTPDSALFHLLRRWGKQAVLCWTDNPIIPWVMFPIYQEPVRQDYDGIKRLQERYNGNAYNVFALDYLGQLSNLHMLGPNDRLVLQSVIKKYQRINGNPFQNAKYLSSKLFGRDWTFSKIHIVTHFSSRDFNQSVARGLPDHTVNIDATRILDNNLKPVTFQ